MLFLFFGKYLSEQFNFYIFNNIEASPIQQN